MVTDGHPGSRDQIICRNRVCDVASPSVSRRSPTHLRRPDPPDDETTPVYGRGSALMVGLNAWIHQPTPPVAISDQSFLPRLPQGRLELLDDRRQDTRVLRPDFQGRGSHRFDESPQVTPAPHDAFPSHPFVGGFARTHPPTTGGMDDPSRQKRTRHPGGLRP